MTITRIHTAHRLSKIVISGTTAYLAGQVAGDTLDGDIRAQTAEVLAKIDALLADAGTDKSRMLQAQIFLKELSDAPGMNEVWDAWVAPQSSPARATTQAHLNNPRFLIEVLVIAEVDARA
ncbi:MAG: RidA family protein [Pandoraea sp.]|nr:RidA family protein [Pandoraea sp.]MDR3400746.1 RidA family protein [Pandoraea sp.]